MLAAPLEFRVFWDLRYAETLAHALLLVRLEQKVLKVVDL